MTTVTFDWDFSDPDVGDSQRAYELQYRLNSGVWTNTGKVVSSVTDRTVAGLGSGNYDWQVRTWDQADTVGPWSAIRSFVINLAPTANNVAVSSPTVVAGSQLTVTWQHSDPEGDAQAKRQIRFKKTSIGTWTEQAEVSNATQSGTIDTTGFGNDTYEVQVRTADLHGYGSWSASVQFNTVTAIFAVPAAISLNSVPPFAMAAVTVISPAAIVTLAVVPPVFTVENRLHPPVPVITLAAPVSAIGGAYTLHNVPSSQMILGTAGEITIYWNGLFAKSAGLSLAGSVPTMRAYIKPAVPTYTTLQYRAKFIEGFTRITRRVEILQSNGKILWDDKVGNKSRLISGNISVDYDRDERRSADLELANFDGALVHKPDGFWYDKVLRAYRGVEFYDTSGKRSYEVAVGSFMIDRVSESRFPKTVKVTARDFTKKCLLSKFTQATGFTANETIESVISALAANAGVNDRIIPVTGKTLGRDIIFERGDSRWQAMKEIATAHSYELFFDAQGYLVMRPFFDPTLSPVSHEFKTGLPDGNLVTWDRSANDTRIFNHISVIGAEGGSDTIPVWADARNTNPNSPTRIELLGDRVDTYESALVTTFAQAQELADTFLKISALEEYEINMQSLVLPWLEAGEIVRFIPPNRNPSEPDRFLLTSFNIPLGLEPMAAVGRRVTIVS